MTLDLDLTTVGAICGIAASVWLILRDVVPLASRTTPRVVRFVKRKYSEHRDANAREQAELAEQALRNERRAVLEVFETSVLRLLDMEQSRKSYHSTEWKRQIVICKHDALRALRQTGIKMGSNSVHHGPWIVRFETGSIVVDWGPCKRNLGRVRLVVFQHPNPSLTMDDLFDFQFSDRPIELVKVLSKFLTDADMKMVGWEYYNGWSDDDGE